MARSASDMVRVNTRISKTCNEWLDERSKETGMPKSTLIHLALEQYMAQVQTIQTMSNTNAMMAMLEAKFGSKAGENGE